MSNDQPKSAEAVPLRERAEAELRHRSQAMPDTSVEGVDKLVHELQTHQIELEMQNEELRRAQEELLESRDSYSDLYDFAPVGYLTVGQKGIVLQANLTAAEMLGVERARLVENPLSAFVMEEDQDDYYQHHRLLIETRASRSCELRMRKEGGVPFWVSMESVVMEDGPGGEIRTRSVIADVTERRRAEKEIEDLARFPSENPHPVMRVGADCTVLYANAASRPLLDSLGSGVGRVLPSEWCKQRAGACGSESQWQVDVTHKERIFSFNVVPVRGAGYSNWYGRDITERSRTEEALKLNESRLAAMLEMSRMGSKTEQETAEFALEKGVELTRSRIGFVGALSEDETVMTMYNWSKAVMKECTIEQKPVTFRVVEAGLWGEVVRSREPVVVNDYQNLDAGRKRHPQGHVPIIRYLGIPAFDGDRIVLIAGVANKEQDYDQSDVRQLTLLMTGLWDHIRRMRAEDALKTLNEELESRVAERTEVAERRAEDLRRLAAELSLAEHHERKRLAKVLHDDLQQLLLAAKLRLASIARSREGPLHTELKMVTDLLDECMGTSRDLTMELSPLVLSRGTLREVLEWLGRRSEEKHGLTVTVKAGEPTPPVPEHVRVSLFQAVRELLFNVVKHSGAMEAQVALSSGGDCLTVQVEDAGKDFDSKTAEQRIQLASGFGLVSAQERIEALGGRMEIGTTPSGGACFRLIVPVESLEQPSPEEIQTAQDTRPPDFEDPQSDRDVIRLLLVDDHKIVREGFILVLAPEQDIEVVGEAADGEEAIRQTEALQPEVIIMDAEMPTMDGVEATRQITRRWPDIRIIGLSLHEEEAFARAMTDAGAAAYLSKQVPARDLVAAIRRCRGRA